MGEKPSKTECTIAVCAGRACAEAKSKKLRSRLKELVAEQGLEESVKVKKTSCQGDCGHGPIVCIEPKGKRLERVKPKGAEKVLAKAVKRKGA